MHCQPLAMWIKVVCLKLIVLYLISNFNLFEMKFLISNAYQLKPITKPYGKPSSSIKFYLPCLKIFYFIGFADLPFQSIFRVALNALKKLISIIISLLINNLWHPHESAFNQSYLCCYCYYKSIIRYWKNNLIMKSIKIPFSSNYFQWPPKSSQRTGKNFNWNSINA